MAMALLAGINLGTAAGSAAFSTDDRTAIGDGSVDRASSGPDSRYTPGFAESLILGLQQTSQ